MDGASETQTLFAIILYFLVSAEVFFHIYLNYLRLNPMLSTSSQFSLQQDEISSEPSN